MREIRFRAWDSQYNKMLPSVTIYADAASIGLTLEEAEKHYTEEQLDGTDNHLYGGDDWIFVMNEFELMQFTGLTDKNGKEIYEGDVCRFFWNPILNEPSELFETEQPVSYYTGWGCFVFHWQSQKMKKKQRELFEDYGMEERYVAIGSPIMYGQGVEVIGNIFENPELLNNL